MDVLSSQIPSAKTAITVLEQVVHANNPACAAFFLGPNMVLTLAGARMLGDGVFYHPDTATIKMWENEIRKGLATVKEHAKSLVFTSVEVNGIKNTALKNVTYELYSSQGFINTEPQYSFISPEVAAKITSRPFDILKRHTEYIDILRQNPMLQSYNDEEIQHIAAGTYLGYPEQAILQSVKQWNKPEDQFADQPVQANIKGARYYGCPHPIYEYPRALTNDPEITAHEKLWSQILHDVYTSDFHLKLQRDPTFTKLIKEIDAY